jgi:hypothetical protein
MARLGSTLVAAAFVWLIGLGPASVPALGREVKLTVRPQKVSAEAGKYALLPPAASLTDGDAVPLYEKAVKALPGKVSADQVQQWLKMPIEQLPIDQVGEALAQYVESFKCVAQAIKCRDCRWPASTPETPEANLQQYRNLALAVRLWARYEIAQENYENAVLALRTGFGMARQLGQAPTLIQLQVGFATASVLCREIEQLVQMEGSPNLYSSLANLPKPFLDPEKTIETERKATSSRFSGKLSSKELESQMKPTHDRTRAIAKSMDSDLAALQCVEAIRSYAASHAGQLPPTLTEITEVSVPKDPMSGAAFRYARTGATAVFESTAPAGGAKTDELHYEITVKN